MRPDLFVGITTWNSELFLEHCLVSIRKRTEGVRLRLGVVDNRSSDRSVEIARDCGAEVQVEHCSQAIALNRLLAMSDARHTLLIHSDVVLLSPTWYETCSKRLAGGVALVSPEDIGCGPMTRPYGAGKPESSFMLFDTAKARASRTWILVRRQGVPWPIRNLELDAAHTSHALPEILARQGYTWHPMRVHASPRSPDEFYAPPFTPEYWSEDLGALRYGMGNFYSLAGEITHYHNWFDRVPKNVTIQSNATTEGSGRGLPVAFLSLGTRRLLSDLEAGCVVLPAVDEPPVTPRVTRRNIPDLSRPFSPASPRAEELPVERT